MPWFGIGLDEVVIESNNYLCNSVAYKWHTVLLRWSQKVNWQPQTFQITAKCIIGTMRKFQPSHLPLLMNTCTVMSICIIFLVYVLYNLVMGINSVNSSIVHDVLQCPWALLFFHPILVPYWLAALEILYGKERKRSSPVFPWHMIWHVFGTTHISQISAEFKVNFSSIHSASSLWWEKEGGIKRKSWTIHALYTSMMEGKG